MTATAAAETLAESSLPVLRLSRRRQLRADFSVARRLVAAAIDKDRPLMAHLVVTRRCNLSCGYCTEYDKVSPPVPLAELQARVDHLAGLGTVFVTLTGGETLLHPQIVELVRYIRARKMIAALNTNGYLLTRERILELGRAGLYAMQISVDNVTPNEISKKSLKPLRPKLLLLARHASFRVRVNTVLGAAPPAECLEVARFVTSLGLEAKCSFARDAEGHLLPVSDEGRAVYDQICAMSRRGTGALREDFQVELLRDGQIEWKCRAGARFFTVCEDGLVHLCTPKMGLGAKPLASYTVDDIRVAFETPKPCAATCPVAYAHQGSSLDGWRSQPRLPSLPAPGAVSSWQAAQAATLRSAGKVHLAVVR
jgi:MoaA/NifB/PqqE/SkfB family radical SAM enzyme